ncbi:hypothetical protein H5410_018783 [Solanum commersonii]|uniref:Uncharacterized protein n=1 Tax=Solanum commersonii TaxID=4109 RepID=A0A9J6A4E2_SOLCO|nr:hypothetical protein H5410_018783 [Solanum commersonii]
MEKLFCSSINLVRNEGCTDYDSDDIHWPVLIYLAHDLLEIALIPLAINQVECQIKEKNANTKFILASHDEASMTLVYKELVSTKSEDDQDDQGQISNYVIMQGHCCLPIKG